MTPRRSFRSASKASSTSASATTSRSSCAASRRWRRAIAAEEPFDAAAIKRSKGKPQVNLLARKPTAAARKKALALAGPEDVVEFSGREMHWLPSTGLSETEVDLKALDKALGKGTMRTLGTIEQIAAKYCGD